MFKKTGYQIVRKALSKELTSFCYSAKVRKALERMIKDGCKEAEDRNYGTIGDGRLKIVLVFIQTALWGFISCPKTNYRKDN